MLQHPGELHFLVWGLYVTFPVPFYSEGDLREVERLGGRFGRSNRYSLDGVERDVTQR